MQEGIEKRIIQSRAGIQIAIDAWGNIDARFLQKRAKNSCSLQSLAHQVVGQDLSGWAKTEDMTLLSIYCWHDSFKYAMRTT